MKNIIEENFEEAVAINDQHNQGNQQQIEEEIKEQVVVREPI